ncbi:aldolase/citrate lyase family protein [Salinicoccus roseus]|uniref:Aldolase n=1 Tax=Salinicoccus roseus TaxID=45670 RepID=A0A265E5K7_9STAP|nr:aldolase/citrate lyase family protein [Salinicoccus roseus]OZT76874.1 aldolase [Salinicoccus roseus]
MTLTLMYITNDPRIASIAENNGVDWIFIDLEKKGKQKRQGHLDTVISNHSLDDIKKVRGNIDKAKLLVRTNPLNEDTSNEVDKCIEYGADILMLPYFKGQREVKEFIDIVDNRAEVCLLLETPEAVDDLQSYIHYEGIDYIHIGLNDLHLGYNKKFMFELLVDGTVENITEQFKFNNIKFGFGGIARLGSGTIPAERIIAEHYRLQSSMAILSRSFYNENEGEDYKEIEEKFSAEMKKMREYENRIKDYKDEFFFSNRKELEAEINGVLAYI